MTGTSGGGGLGGADPALGRLDLSRRGGAGTFRGTDYQLRVAVREALKAIVRQFAAPHRVMTITLESLRVADGRTEKWDVVTGPHVVAREAKSAPTAADIRTFAARAAGSGAAEVVFVYAEHSGPTQRALERLIGFAAAAEDVQQFERMVLTEPTLRRKLPGEILRAYERLRTVKVQSLPEQVLEEDVGSRAAMLAGECGTDLVAMLIDLFSVEAGSRRVHRVPDLLGFADQRGIRIRVPQDVGGSMLPVATHGCLLLLQETGANLPIEVVAQAVGRSISDLNAELGRLDPGVVNSAAGILSMSPIPVRVVSDERNSVLGRGLEGLLSWIDANGDTVPEALVDVAIALGTTLERSYPAAVARMFPVLDKRLKARGSKRLVLEVANRSISAAQRAPIRNDDVMKAEAVALICGRSWVYQRIGELEKAHADGEASLQIGESIGWKRNTAFCEKCLGRLCRMQAESSSDGNRDDHLRESVQRLKAAIRLFAELDEDLEVGDSFSLLGRTYLVAGDLPAADSAVRAAAARLNNRRHKDFLDLQILCGDLAVERRDLDSGERYYSVVLEVPGADPSVTEIEGRAHHQLGRLCALRGQAQKALNEYGLAARVFTELEEVDRAALSDLEAMVLRGRVPTAETELEVFRLMASEPPLVQVLAVRAHERAVAQFDNASIVAFREPATLDYWNRMIATARSEAVRARRGW